MSKLEIFAERIRRFEYIVTCFIYSFNMEEMMNGGVFNNRVFTDINDEYVEDDDNMGIFDGFEDN